MLASRHATVDLAALITRGLSPEMRAAFPASIIAGIKNRLPLKTGQVLWRDLPDAKPDQKMSFGFEIAFFESRVIEGEPVAKFFQECLQYVEGVLLGFAPFL
jgi:hypothetical protein